MMSTRRTMATARRSLHWALCGAMAAICAGCGGGSDLPSKTADDGVSDAAGADDTGPVTDTQRRLVGTWEMARFESSEPMPNEVMPLLGEMFETLLLTFEERHVQAGKERTAYSVKEVDGDSFVLVVDGGMFDGANCRFVDDDEIEVLDNGPQWPGLTLLRRSEP